MKHTRMRAGSFAAVLNPLAGIAAVLAGATGGLSASAMPARGVEVPFTERVISTTANGQSCGEGWTTRPSWTVTIVTFDPPSPDYRRDHRSA